MRIDLKKFRNFTCKKCHRYSEKPIFGKCLADKTDIYRCARREIFERKRYTE